MKIIIPAHLLQGYNYMSAKVSKLKSKISETLGKHINKRLNYIFGTLRLF
jgi:hypothetical protein